VSVTYLVKVKGCLKKVNHVLATSLKAEAKLWLAEGQKAKAKN
jgi:hypothetical protein